MQLTIKDVSKFFNVSERTVYRWIDKNAIPVYKVCDQYRFNRGELIEWAYSKRLPFSRELVLDEAESQQGAVLPSLHDTIAKSGIYYRIEGKSKAEVLKNMMSVIRLPDEADRELLLQMMLFRERLASTGIGDGIAIPHVRNPVILNVVSPLVSICFLENRIDFGSLDGIPVFCLFNVVSPSIRVHLHLMARTAFVLKDAKLRKVLSMQAARGEILEAVANAEKKITMRS